jgi:hypothetical protein
VAKARSLALDSIASHVSHIQVMHEDFSRRTQVTTSSDRAFGLVWTVALAIYGLAPLRHGASVRAWPMAVAVLLFLLSLCAPGSLHRPNLLAAKVAVLLHRITNPVVMGIIFYGFFAPVAIFNRWRKKDPLGLHFDKAASTYWIRRDPPGPPSDGMINQF